MKKQRQTQGYQNTIYACFIGYIVQAVVNNFAPLLFLTFQKTYAIPMTQITLLITLNFSIQLLVDLVSAVFVDKVGYRISIVTAHGFAAAGLILLALLPGILSNPFSGLLIGVVIYAIGGGLIEVLISPIMEACPTDNKEKAMSLLHSFYCWGSVSVILVSTLFFKIFGIGNWKVMAVLWSILPIANAVLFTLVPLYPLVDEKKESLPLKSLFSMKFFWIMVMLMVCAGACEQGISQWASTYAEAGLGVSKTLGDLLGPMLFSICMGSSRFIYGKWGEKIDIKKFMFASALLCLISYVIVAASPVPAVGLIGCGLCGFSVGILWPGTFSLASSGMRQGGTAVFALLALAGDLGCSAGPTYIGFISGQMQGSLSKGIMAGVLFPIFLIAGLCLNNGLKS